MKNLKLISVLIITLIMNVRVFATQQTYETLTIDEATEKAISYSRTLKTLEENNILAQDNYDDVISDYLITDQSHEALNLVTRLTSARNQLDNIKANQELEKESIRLSIINFFMNVLTAEEELQLYEENLAIAEKELKIAEVKKNFGLMSESDYNTQKIAYDKQVTEKNNKETSIDTAYRSLNKVLGNDLDKRYNLVIDEEYLTFTELGNDTSLSRYIIKGLNSSNKLKELQQDVDLKKYQVDTYSSTTTSESLQSKEISYAQSQRSLSEFEINLEETITNLYNNTLKYEESYTAKLKDIEKQKNDLKILEVKYNLGKATELEVEKAKYQIKTLELELKQIIFSHNINKMKLENINLA